METKYVKILDDGVHGDVDLKRRRTYNDEPNNLKLHLETEIRDNVHVAKGFEESKKMVEDIHKKIVPKEGLLDVDYVKEIFSRGIGSSFCGELVSLQCGSCAFIEGQHELFKKQVDIVKTLQYEENVHYAWLTSKNGVIYNAMKYGLGCHIPSNIISTYEIGDHLIPVSFTNISAALFEIDKNNVGNILLCRIMGKLENVYPTSKQFYSCSDDFDNGVDDLQTIKHYTGWIMNTNTYIYPEYVVSFKMPSDSKDLQNGNRMNVLLGTNYSQLCQAQVSITNHAYMEEAKWKSMSHLASYPVRLPKSPWMYFTVLLDVISSKLSIKDMHLMNLYFEMYRNKLIRREDFIMKLRLTVGDTLLRSTLTNLQNKVPSKYHTQLGNMKGS